MTFADARPDARTPALDGLRGVAILLVLLSHSYAALPLTLATALPIAVGRVGWAGVDLFFVLSGFLITGILRQSRGAPGAFRAFYLRRALRIWPLYLAVLCLLTVLARTRPDLAPADARQFLQRWPWYWTHTVNLLFAWQGRLGADAYATSHFWSLGIEEQFYLVWPLAVAACPPRRLPALCLAIAGGSIALRALLLALGVDPMATYTLPVTRLDALAVGGWLASGAPTGSRVRALRGAATRATLLRWTLGAVALLAGLSALRVGQFTALMQLVGFPVVTAAAALCVATARDGDATPLGRWLAWRPLGWLGRRSYGLYVLHLPLFYAVALWAGRVRLPVAVQLGTAYALTVAAAALSWRVWETPWLALKRFVPMPGGSGTTTPASRASSASSAATSAYPAAARSASAPAKRT